MIYLNCLHKYVVGHVIPHLADGYKKLDCCDQFGFLFF